LLLPERERVKVIFSCSHQRSRCQLMNSLPLLARLNQAFSFHACGQGRLFRV